MQDVVDQAMDCEEKFLARADFYKKMNQGMWAIVVVMVITVGTVVTCNSKSVAKVSKFTEKTLGLKEDQDNTAVYIGRLDATIDEHGKLLEALKTSTAQMGKQIDRLEFKVDRTRGTLNAILTEVKKP